MAIEASGGIHSFTAFFDGGEYTPLFFQQDSAVSAAYGFAGGQPAYAVLQTGMAVSAADIDLACRALSLAAKTGNPVVTFYAAKGSKLQEGQKALSAVAKWNTATARLSGVVPQLAVVTGICGASAAIAAVSADLCIMSKDAELFLTSPFLSEAAGDTLEGAGTADFAQKAGVAALVADTAEDAARLAAKIIALLPSNNIAQPATFEFAPSDVKLDIANYTAENAVASIVDAGSVQEFYTGFGRNIMTALATIEGNVVGVVATTGPDHRIGKGSAGKAARFVRLCDAFNLPVVTLINTNGFNKSSTVDVTGGIRAAARLASTYADSTTAKIAVITGKAVGPAYTALSNADLTIVLDGAVIAPAEPSAIVTVLYRQEIEASSNSIEAETIARARQYEAEEASAAAALKNGLADFVVQPETLRPTIANALTILSSKRASRLPKKHGNMPL